MCFEHFCVKRLPDRQRQTSFLQQLLRKNRPSHHPEILAAAAGLIYCSNQLHKTTFSFYICKLLQAISQNSCDNIFYIQKLFIVYNFFWLNCVICITEFWQRHFRKYLIPLRTLLLGGGGLRFGISGKQQSYDLFSLKRRWFIFLENQS